MSNENLAFLQSLNEQEITELVIMPLLDGMGYQNIRYTHGPLEYGKDIVFSSTSPLDGQNHFCATIKSKALTGSVSKSSSIREVYFQIMQALTEPFVDPFDGSEKLLDYVYVITPYVITQGCVKSIRGELKQLDNRVKFIDGPNLLKLISEYLPSLLSYRDPKLRYIFSLSQRFTKNRIVNKLGGMRDFSLFDIYTGGQLSKTSIEEAKNISFALPQASNHSSEITEFFSANQHLIILADVGAGKTTLLQKFFLDLTSNIEERRGVGVNIPIFVPLASLTQRALLEYDTFLKALVKYVTETERYKEFSLRNSNRYVLLLDGFDEISSHHTEVSHHIQKLTEVFPKGVLLTSRPSRIPEMQSQFVYLRLHPFSNSDIKTFLKKWFPENSSLQQELHNRITTDETLSAFCRSPLMLTLYTILATRYSVDQLPVRRNDIYDSIVNLLLGEWDMFRSIKNEFSTSIKEFALENLAFKTHSRNSKYFSHSSFQKLVEEIVDTAKIQASPGSLLGEIIYRSSLVKYTNRGPYTDREKVEFAHLSFQEYFAAKHLIKSGNIKRIQRYLYNDWWKNTLMFCFGIKRSMDGLSIPTNLSKTKGKGFRLLEYLSEADYTSQAIRSQVFTILGHDILYSRNLTQNDLEICIRNANELINALTPIISEIRTRESELNKVNAYNVLKLLIFLDPNSSNKDLWSASGRLLNRVNPQDLILLLNDLLPYFKKNIWIEHFTLLLQSVSRKLRTPQKRTYLVILKSGFQSLSNQMREDSDIIEEAWKSKHQRRKGEKRGFQPTVEEPRLGKYKKVLALLSMLQHKIDDRLNR